MNKYKKNTIGGNRPRRPYGRFYRLVVQQLYYASPNIGMCTK